MADIVTFDREGAIEIAREIRDLRGKLRNLANRRHPTHFPDSIATFYHGKADGVISGWTTATSTPGSGAVDIYHRNTDTGVSEDTSRDIVTAYNTFAEISSGEPVIVARDAWGDYWVISPDDGGPSAGSGAEPLFRTTLSSALSVSDATASVNALASAWGAALPSPNPPTVNNDLNLRGDSGAVAYVVYDESTTTYVLLAVEFLPPDLYRTTLAATTQAGDATTTVNALASVWGAALPSPNPPATVNNDLGCAGVSGDTAYVIYDRSTSTYVLLTVKHKEQVMMTAWGIDQTGTNTIDQKTRTVSVMTHEAESAWTLLHQGEDCD